MKVFDGPALNIEYDLSLPTLVGLDELETMEANGFHVGASGVARPGQIHTLRSQRGYGSDTQHCGSSAKRSGFPRADE